MANETNDGTSKRIPQTAVTGGLLIMSGIYVLILWVVDFTNWTSYVVANYDVVRGTIYNFFILLLLFSIFCLALFIPLFLLIPIFKNINYTNCKVTRILNFVYLGLVPIFVVLTVIKMVLILNGQG